MVTRYKHTYGDGSVDFVEIDIPEEEDVHDEEATDQDYQNALEQMGVNFDEGQ